MNKPGKPTWANNHVHPNSVLGRLSLPEQRRIKKLMGDYKSEHRMLLSALERATKETRG